MKSLQVSEKTRKFWTVDALLGISAVIATVSGVYFLFSPLGYQGGRNPLYSTTILFDRTTWDLLHTWFGLLMVVIAAIHLILHWDWVVKMTKKMLILIQGKACGLTAYGQFNIWLDFVLAVSFLLTAVSGVALLAITGIPVPEIASGILLSQTAWDMIHTWASIVMTITAIVHLAIHWRWVVNVSRKILLRSGSIRQAENQTCVEKNSREAVA
ncbi:MAG: DUF4405 domain-containing protein [Chloroflexi bacterium]|nr:DUF4405 domain-containing protein [Chloroflexota bacterium]